MACRLFYNIATKLLSLTTRANIKDVKIISKHLVNFKLFTRYLGMSHIISAWTDYNTRLPRLMQVDMSPNLGLNDWNSNVLTNKPPLLHQYTSLLPVKLPFIPTQMKENVRDKLKRTRLNVAQFFIVISHIFARSQTFEHHHAYFRPKTVIFLTSVISLIC